MYVFEASIENKNGCEPEKLADQFDLALKCLSSNGQIWKDWPTIQEKDVIRACIRAHEKKSLQKKFCNIYFLDNRRKLEKMAGAKMTFDFRGITSDHTEPCHCKEYDYFILQTAYSHTCSPITCGSCNAAVPLYYLPYIGEEQEYSTMRSWVENYIGCDTLNMACGFGEKWAVKQMSDPNSGLSKEGRVLCESIEELTGIPTYYYLYNYYGGNPRFKNSKSLCPLCGKKWFQGDDVYWAEQFRCNSCRIVANLYDI